MTYKTTGTLKEIGAKVGDVVRWEWNGEECAVCDWMFGVWDGQYTIISRATPSGPVRTVTRKEIVPGVYGAVRINGVTDYGVDVDFIDVLDHYHIDAAIATLTEIRDAL